MFLPGQPARTVLHDNVEDPHQLENVAARRPGVVRTLSEQELTPWLTKAGDPWSLPS